jgi:phosphonate transport system substrate-binding protein
MRFLIGLLPTAALLISVLSCGGPRVHDAATESEPIELPSGVITVGSVSLNPTREHEIVGPFARYLAAQLTDVGIGAGRVVVTDSLSKMVTEINQGTVDIFIDSPFPVAFVLENTDARIVVRRWKRGFDSYRSVVFTRADSGVETLNDLTGKVIAFGEPFSTSGFLIPKAAMLSAGLQLDNYEDPAAQVPSDRVGYVFSNDTENTMFWVLKQKVAAGAVNENYYQSLAGNRVDELRILFMSEPVPRNLVCVRGGLEPRVEKALKRVLLEMNQSSEGLEVLWHFEETTKFDRASDVPEEVLAGVIELLPYVNEDLGG